MVWLKDKKSRLLAVNQMFAKMANRKKPEEVVGKTDLDIWPAKFANKYRRDDRKVMKTRDHVMVEELISEKGVSRWHETFKAPVLDADGKVIGTTGFARDITERKKAEVALEEGRYQLRQIIDAVPYMIYAKDGSGRFLLVNRAVGEMYGKDPEALIGIRREDIHGVRDEASSFLELDKEVLATGQPKIAPEEKFTDAKGDVHILQTIKMPFKMQGIDETVILGVSVDVTDQKKVEEFRNDIVRTVSHELRTPLSIEKEGISLLLDETAGEINAQQKIILEAVMKNIERLARMIDSLLDISHIEARKTQLNKTMVCLQDLVRDVIVEFKTKASKKGIELRPVFSEEKARVFVDSDKIMQVISNLVDNAMKFTQKGTIEIAVKILKNEVECSVQDTGVGISAEYISKIFEKFQQFGRVVGPGEKGLGLGLSISKGIIEMHQGRIWAKSEPGQGTRVTFTLPLQLEKGA